MDPEQTFIRVQERFSQMLTPRIRASLEYIYLFVAITLFCILVVMHANYVQQPGCSSQLTGVETTEAQLIQIKITSAGLWSQNVPQYDVIDVPVKETKTENLKVEGGDGLIFLAAKSLVNWIGSSAKKDKLTFKFWKPDHEHLESQPEISSSSESSKPDVDDVVLKINKEESRFRFPLLAKESFKAAIVRICRKWHGRLSFCWRHAKRILGGLWNIAGIHLNLDIPKWLHILHLDRLNSYAVFWLEKRSKAFEPTYLYTMEKGYFLLPEASRSRHNIRTVNISISARHSCFGNRWQQLLINRLVGYDTILMNSLLSSPGQGYLYNYQTKEFYNLTYAHEQPESAAKFGDYLVTKCGVLMMSLFVFFTTTMSVSFTLRETQTRMLKFTVQLQHHARHRLPTFQLIFVHVIESLVFVPIMIGILFFLFEFYDDQLLAFMVLILVWLCELFTLISVRTPISMKFFPRFFLLYFLVFHIYFFSYTYGFSYLALSTTAAFMQHLILYFWNRFEVPALQRFMQNRRSQFQQHPDFHITSSTILASTLHITRLNTRNPNPVNTDLISGTGPRAGSNPVIPTTNTAELPGLRGQAENDNSNRGPNPLQVAGQPDIPQAETGANAGTMNSFSNLLLWILGGASSEGLNSFLSLFRDVRDQGGQVYPEPARQENHTSQNALDGEMPSGRSGKRRIVSFVGGIDLCDGRYDTPFHSLFRTLDTVHHNDFHQPNFTGASINKGGPREPWHDIHCRLEGPIAWDVLFNFEQRWRKQGGKEVLIALRELENIIIPPSPVMYPEDNEIWNVQLFRSIDGGAAFGFPESPEDAAKSGLISGKDNIIDRSIQDGYINAIRRAKNFIYIENQYFLGSCFGWNSSDIKDEDIGALHLIPKELSLKILSKIESGERFTVYIVLPMWPEGIPESSSVQAILDWQRRTMQMMYTDIAQAIHAKGINASPKDYLTFFCLGNRETPKSGEYVPSERPENDTDYSRAQQARRFMIYVHAKMMIVDDEYIIIGSANINQRSMDGARDSEIAMGGFQPYHLATRQAARGQIHGFRMSLWYEHLGMLDNSFLQPESLDCIRKVNQIAEKYWDLYSRETLERDLPGHLLTYPVGVTADGQVTELPGTEFFPDTKARVLGTKADFLPPILTT